MRAQDVDEELMRILATGQEGAYDVADERARLAKLGAGYTDSGGEDFPRGTKVVFADEPEVAAPLPSRVPLRPAAPAVPNEKFVDLTQQPTDDLEMAYASAQDRKARAAEAFERGSRQLVAGLTQTPVVASTLGPTDAVAKLLAARKRRDEDAQRNEQNRLGAEKFNYERETEAQKAAEAKARDERDTAFAREKFDADQKNDVLNRESRDRASDAMRAMAGMTFGATQKNRASEDLSSLRKEFNALPDVKAFNEVDASFKKIESAATNDSPAGDLALITGFMKIIDPGSSVKEGEFANAQNAGGVPEKIQAQYNSIVNGERLAPSQRADFLRQAKALHDVHRQRYEGQATRYRTLATRQGASPDDVVELPTRSAAPNNSGTITIRRKSDGSTRSLPIEQAKKVLADPKYEEVK
jgi:hypothetical protein